MITLPETTYDIVGSIVLYNTPPDEVAHAVTQFFAMSEHCKLNSHLCVIDNSPAPVNLASLSDRRISYHFANRNLGYGRAHNIAFRASEGRAQYNLIMNTDITYSPDVVKTLKAHLDSSPGAGLCAPKILYPNGDLQHVSRLLPTPLNIFLRRFFPKSRWTNKFDAQYELHWWDHNNIANIPFLSGSFLLAKTTLLSRLKGFDERFFLYAEDVDLCRRFHQISETNYIPHVSITHNFRRYNRHSLRGTWFGLVSHVQYFNKWGWIFDRQRRAVNSMALQRLLNPLPDSLANVHTQT